MSKQNIIGRYTLFLIGLFIASMGVAFSTKAGLGTSPVAFSCMAGFYIGGLVKCAKCVADYGASSFTEKKV